MIFTSIRKLRRDLVLEIIIFSLGVLSIVIFWQKVFLVTILLLTLYFIGNRFWHKKHDYIFYLAGGILGPTTEIICVKFRVWQYSNPTFLGIPLWLPFAWGLAAILIIRIAETCVKIEKKL